MDELVNILLVEDNASDVRLTLEARSSGRMHHQLSVTRDGVEAMAFIRRQDAYKL
jgi:CheY-like chemotaxis protein